MGKNKELRRAENRKAQMDASLQAVAEYARKLEFVQDQSSKLSIKVANIQRQVRTASLALSHLQSTQVASEKYFVQLGRAFIQQSYDSVVSQLNKEKAAGEAELPKLTAALNQFERMRKEQIQRITELKQQ